MATESIAMSSDLREELTELERTITNALDDIPWFDDASIVTHGSDLRRARRHLEIAAQTLNTVRKRGDCVPDLHEADLVQIELAATLRIERVREFPFCHSVRFGDKGPPTPTRLMSLLPRCDLACLQQRQAG